MNCKFTNKTKTKQKEKSKICLQLNNDDHY